MAEDEWHAGQPPTTDKIFEFECQSRGMIFAKTQPYPFREGNFFIKTDRDGNRLGDICIPIFPLRWRYAEGQS